MQMFRLTIMESLLNRQSSMQYHRATKLDNPRQAERSTAHPNRSPLMPKDFLRKSA